MRRRRSLVAGIAEGWDALLDIENQRQGARGPVALGVLADDLLGET